MLEDVPEEDNDLFNQFTPQEETHSQDEGPSTSTVSDILYYFSNLGYMTCYTCMLTQTCACTFMHARTHTHIHTHNLVPNHIKCTPNNYSISCNNIGSFCYFLSVQSVRSVTFNDLISMPQRERAIRKRVKPPSYNLTSEQHIEYIQTKKSSSKHPAKQASWYPGSKQPKGKKKQGKRSKSPCKVCNTHYGDPNDPKATEEWLKCVPCSAWFHESCGEDNGICADDGFICKDCV